MYILTLAYQVYKHIKILCSIYLNLSFKLPQTFFTYENYVLSMLPRFQLRMLKVWYLVIHIIHIYKCKIEVFEKQNQKIFLRLIFANFFKGCFNGKISLWGPLGTPVYFSNPSMLDCYVSRLSETGWCRALMAQILLGWVQTLPWDVSV